MTQDQLIAHIERLMEGCLHPDRAIGHHAQVCEFLRAYAGPNNSFYEAAKQLDPQKGEPSYASRQLSHILSSFLEHVQRGLAADISPERQAQLDVVSDYLEMARLLLETKDVHPAAPAVLIGATLEEFLRTWVHAARIPLGSLKPSIESYSQVLRTAHLITKQDGKDITAWAGIRNYAAHGEWQEVYDKSRISILLEGVN